MNSINTVGLITYHAAYNFGSVLQTYGLVHTLTEMGVNVETIDYRTHSQSIWYTDDKSLMKNWRQKIYNWRFNIIKKERKRRRNKFENFIGNYLNISTKLYQTYEELTSEDLSYEVLVAGSDQIWNIACSEFQNEPANAILPYFLVFGNAKKKIAYASSFGGQSFNYIKKWSEKYLKGFDKVSTREPINRDFMAKILGDENVKLVSDPTWLLSKTEWNRAFKLDENIIHQQYILVYLLGMNYRDASPWLNKIKVFASQYNMEVKLISPLNFNSEDGINHIYDAGPIDFLKLLYNASFVFTNTFHGTIFSINFEKPFYTLQATPSSRQGQMLDFCDLQDRIVLEPQEIDEYACVECNFNVPTKRVTEFREQSKQFLYNAIKL